MLIKVFDRWINPNSITSVESFGNDVRIFFGGMAPDADGNTVYDHIQILAKTPDEVAEEINRQITATGK